MMMSRTESVRQTAAAASCLLALLLLAGPGAASAQTAAPDAGWQAWLGCWEPADATSSAPRADGDAPVVCVIPASDASAVEIATVVDGAVVERERVTAGERRPSDVEGCTGWESVTWSADGRRLYRLAEHVCAGGLERRSTGLMAMSSTGEWLDVQGVSAGGYTGVRAARYREVTDPDALPAEVRAARQGRALSTETARMAAAAPLTTADVVEASRRLDPEVVEAWLVEREEGFAIDADRLVELADAGVPERVIDLMVALSYPEVFAIDRSLREGEFRPGEETFRPGQSHPRPVAVWDPWGFPGYYGPGYGYSGLRRYGYGGYYGYGYGGYYPVVIVPRGSVDGESPRPRARAVNGRGYTRGGGSSGASTSTAPARPSSSGGASKPAVSRPSSGKSGPAATSSSSGSGNSRPTRTAKPRPDTE